MTRTLRLWLAVSIVVISVASGLPCARAQNEHPVTNSRERPPELVRSGSILLALGAASAGASAGLLSTQPDGSWGAGVGVAHLLLAAGYLYDGSARLIYSRRLARRGISHIHETRCGWVCWANTLGAAALTGAGVAIGLQRDDYARGFGVSLAVHGAWYFAWSLRKLIRIRRGHELWMVQAPGLVRF